jgi:uncharacterized membrane protein
MVKTTLLKVVNPLLFFVFIVQAFTGILMFLEKDTELCSEIHEYNGLVMIGLIIIHITLNWGWIKATFFRKAT